MLPPVLDMAVAPLRMCRLPAPDTEVSALAPAPKPALLPKEAHLTDLRQLTFGGENAEAYWSFDGKELSFQARLGGEGCDRIRRITLDPLDEAARLQRQRSDDLRALPSPATKS